MSIFRWFRRNAAPIIPTAEQTRKAVAEKNDKHYDALRIEIGTWFRNGNHPYDNLSRYQDYPCVADYHSNAKVDYLKSELEALGYEVLTRIYKVRHHSMGRVSEYSEHDLEYRVVKIKDL
jgi:hypothetical protein